MKKTSFALVASALTADALFPYYTQRYISTNNVIKANGQAAYLGGNDGVLATAVELTPSVNIWYQYYDSAAEASMHYAALELAPDTFPETVAMSPAGGSLRNLFTSTYSATASGTVQYYQGEYSSWSLQQTLSPPNTIDSARNYFGSVLAFDRENYDTLYVACGNCSTPAGKGHGAIYLYNQDRAPGKKSWSQTQVVTFDKLSGLGSSKLVVSKDLLLTSTTSNGPVLIRKVGENYVPEQLLAAPGGSTSNFDVYDNTIALSNTAAGHGSNTNVGAVYMLAAAKPPPLKGKPMPLQWSVQQVLYPTTIENDVLFGAQISLDGNRLAISNGGVGSGANVLAYVYERPSANGKWSVQQTISDLAGVQSASVFLRDSTLMTLQNASKIAYYDQYGSADCLTIQVEDDFGDGWDTARLTVTAPDNSQEYYHSRCDLNNPHKVRYCPANTKMGGIYHFEIPESVKAKNHWEITWRVYDESGGKWYVGSHDSKMDFEWDPVYQKFTPRHMHNTRSNNLTCQYCTPPPTDKPTPVLRRSLKGGSGLPVWPNTAQPTPTPAPTLDTTNFENWRTMTLFGADAWDFAYYNAYYYVSDAKSHRLITSGTLCPGEATGKKCWVDLPDGEYNVRVGGATLGTPTLTWTFCHSTRQLDAQTQLSIKISEGKCAAPVSHLSTSFCGATIPVATAQIEFIVLGVASGEMGDSDRDALTNAIAYAFTGLSKSDVSINSVSSSSGGLYVSANIALSQAMGYDVLSIEGIDSLMTSIQNYMNGNGPRVIWSGLQSSEHHTIFSSSTSVQFLSAEVVGSEDKASVAASAVAVEEVVSYFDQPLSNYNENSKSSSSSLILNSVSASGYFLAVGALVALVVGMYVSSRRAATTPQNTPAAAKEEYVELEATEHSKRVQLKDLKLNAPNLADLKQFVESEDEVLKMMLARGK